MNPKLALLFERRSVRAYAPREIPRSLIRDLLEAGMARIGVSIGIARADAGGEQGEMERTGAGIDGEGEGQARKFGKFTLERAVTVADLKTVIRAARHRPEAMAALTNSNGAR